MKLHGRVLVGMSLAVAIGLGLSVYGGLGVPAALGAEAWTLPTQPITITYWDGGNGTKGDLLKKLIAEYEKLHPTIKVKFETDVPSDKLSVALSTGTAPALIEVSDWNLPKYLAVGALDALPPAAWGQTSVEGVLNTYIPQLLSAMYVGGQLYAVPDQMNAWSFYVNNRLFREAGLDPAKDAPKTWDDVARLNKLLTKKQGDRIVQKGFDMRYVCPDGRWVAGMLQVLVFQAGGEMMRDGKPAFNSAAGIKALSVWKSVTVAPQVTQNTCSSPYQDFGVEQDAMTFAGPNGAPVFEKINPKMKGNYTAVPLPQIRADQPANLIYSFDWAVNAKSPADEKKVAWDLIHYLSTRPAQWWTEIAFLQPVKGWYETPAAKQNPFLQVFIRDMSIGKPRARTTHYGELQTILARMSDRVILNDADPKQALDQAAEEFTRAAK